uniref:J domain-containing protein n=1 Tax=Kalanchoe fedtschenkoi TaxID=63787 RepID=A0A7N0VHF9_KALFE
NFEFGFDGGVLNFLQKWHPDKWTRNPAHADEANRRFQEIQEAYSVLSDRGKKSLYDAGLYDPLEDDEGFSEFMDEMIDMMGKVQNEGESFEDLEKMFKDIFSGDDMFGFNMGGVSGGGGFEVGAGDPAAGKRTRGGASRKMTAGVKRSNARV